MLALDPCTHHLQVPELNPKIMHPADRRELRVQNLVYPLENPRHSAFVVRIPPTDEACGVGDANRHPYTRDRLYLPDVLIPEQQAIETAQQAAIPHDRPVGCQRVSPSREVTLGQFRTRRLLHIKAEPSLYVI